MFKILIVIVSLILLIYKSYAQSPTHYPTPGAEPFELTLANVLVYIVSPVLMVVIYFWYRRSSGKNRKGKN